MFRRAISIWTTIKCKFRRNVLSKQQQLVYNWLNDKLGYPVFAEAYKGAIEFLSLKPSGYVTFVAHTGRDIMNILAPSVAGRSNSGRVEYRDHLDEINKHWEDHWGHEPPPQETTNHPIPHATCSLIKKLLDEHNLGSKRNNDTTALFFQTFFDYQDRSRIPPNYLNEFVKARKWFVKYAHLRSKQFRNGVEDQTKEHFALLDSYLYVAAETEYNRISILNEILEETN